MNESGHTQAQDQDQQGWGAHFAAKRLLDTGEGGATHLIAHEDDAEQAGRWLRAVAGRLTAEGNWKTVEGDEAMDALGGGPDAERWWDRSQARAATDGSRIAVMVPAAAWEATMATNDDSAIYKLLARMSQAGRVHVVAVRNTKPEKDADVHLLIARQRLEMTMSPAHTRD